jgi:hypothetical protein
MGNKEKFFFVRFIRKENSRSIDKIIEFDLIKPDDKLKEIEDFKVIKVSLYNNLYFNYLTKEFYNEENDRMENISIYKFIDPNNLLKQFYYTLGRNMFEIFGKFDWLDKAFIENYTIETIAENIKNNKIKQKLLIEYAEKIL